MSTSNKPATRSLHVSLDYNHANGYLRPYFEGLQHGRAMASHCACCGRTWFPPRPVCPETAEETKWRELEGKGEVVSVTRGVALMPFADKPQEYLFALIAMDGADNLTLGRISGAEGECKEGTRVHLAAVASTSHPAQAAIFVPDQD